MAMTKGPMATAPIRLLLQQMPRQDRARIVFDCRTADDPVMMSSTIPARLQNAE
jgi:hypothetical protein